MSWDKPENVTKEEYVLFNDCQHINKKWYYLGHPDISDSIYDQLEKEQEAVEALHPEWVNEDSAVNYVGYKLELISTDFESAKEEKLSCWNRYYRNEKE